ncbi:homoserine kinase [Orrella sp. JC864]|uniref:homoserine kinase n=1 Tax=Orrella sp. JC864 TaxID=3120298 RepID=UPI00300BC948
MAVFTPVSDQDVSTLLQDYDLGSLVALRGITAGIENSNFFLDTTRGSFVLTVFEVLTAEQLPFYIDLMHHLAERGMPVPQPQPLRSGGRITRLHGKPCAIVTRLPGGYEPAPSAAHCALAGQTLARTHLVGQDFGNRQPNLRGLPWRLATAPKVLPFLDAGQAALLSHALDEQRRLAETPQWQGLPQGPSHCDLFRDNVLFAGTFESPRMGGFIDFYFAGWDHWLFDVAVAVNDWCIEPASGRFDLPRLQAWLRAYAQVRPFTDDERQAWGPMLRAAALRFWLSRLYDYYLPRPAQTLKPHDPRHFERVLRARQADLPELP